MAVAIDPVCGMEVDTERSEYVSEYQGTKFYFCSRGCMLDFEDDPQRYLDPSHEPSGMEHD